MDRVHGNTRTDRVCDITRLCCDITRRDHICDITRRGRICDITRMDRVCDITRTMIYYGVEIAKSKRGLNTPYILQ